MKEKVYISGAMSGLERAEYLARFRRAELQLQSEGYDTVCPTRFAVCRWPWLYRLVGYRLTLLYDLWRLTFCDRIYVIPGSEGSHGTAIEGHFAFHMQIRDSRKWDKAQDVHIRRLPLDIRQKMDKKFAKWMSRRTESEHPAA